MQEIDCENVTSDRHRYRQDKTGSIASISKPILDFYRYVAIDNGFDHVQAENVATPTRISLLLPEYCARILSVADARAISDAKLLSAVVDTFCRSVDSIADMRESNASKSTSLQLATLLLLRAIDIVQMNHKVPLLEIIYSKMGMASVAERELYTIRNCDDWRMRGAVRLLGEKNASLLISPIFLNGLSPHPWPAIVCEEFFLSLFSLVQQIDDIVDLEDDIAALRYNGYQARIEMVHGSAYREHTENLAPLGRTCARESLVAIRDLLSAASIAKELKADLCVEINESLAAIDLLNVAVEYKQFSIDLAEAVPPLVAYSG